MRVLLVAPTNATLTHAAAETAAVARLHDVEIVSGNVRPVDIQMAIEKGPYECVWFITHGNAEGLLLSDTVLTHQAAGAYLSTSRATLCVLNTCASEDFATRIIAGGEADMIFTVSPEIGDADAAQFGSLLAKELAETDDFKEAFHKATGPVASKYRYLGAKQATRSLVSDSATQLEKLREKVITQGESIYKLTVDMAALNTRMESATQQSLLNQQRTMQAAQTGGSPLPVSLYTPTFVLLLLLVVLALGVVIFFAGRGFQPVPVGAAILLVGLLAKLLGVHI